MNELSRAIADFPIELLFPIALYFLPVGLAALKLPVWSWCSYVVVVVANVMLTASDMLCPEWLRGHPFIAVMQVVSFALLFFVLIRHLFVQQHRAEAERLAAICDAEDKRKRTEMQEKITELTAQLSAENRAERLRERRKELYSQYDDKELSVVLPLPPGVGVDENGLPVIEGMSRGDLQVAVSTSGKHYHRPNCSTALYGERVVPLWEVPRGMYPCMRCNPPEVSFSWYSEYLELEKKLARSDYRLVVRNGYIRLVDLRQGRNDGTVHPEQSFASLRSVAENNRLYREGKAQYHISPDYTPEQIRRNMEYNLARELKAPEEDQYRDWLAKPELLGKIKTRAEEYESLTEDERRAKFAEYHYKQLRQYLDLIRDGGYFDA